MSSGFFVIYRKLFDHEIGKNPLTVALWVRLLSDAAYEDRNVFWDGKIIEIKRGQVITSIDKLAHWLKLARSTTKQLLNRLQNVQQIDIKTTNKYTVITIKNYNKYQMIDNKTTSNLSTDRHQTATTKEYKEPKELKETNKRETGSLYFLLNLPDDVIITFIEKYQVSDKQVREKGEALYNYCQANGKKYKNYEAMLRNALQKDFGTRTHAVSFTPDLPTEVNIAGLERLREMKERVLKTSSLN